MAGIGFELRKIFKERSIFNLLRGTFYSAFTVIGPMLIVILCITALFTIMDYQSIEHGQKDLLMSLILYVFIFSLIATNPLSAVVSRYIADKIFEEKLSDILPCYYAGLLINIILAAAMAIPFAIFTAVKGSSISPLAILLAICIFTALVFVFYTMTFISALKDYKSIALAFLIGMAVTLALSYILYKAVHVSFIFSVLTGMASGFILTGSILFALVRHFFKENSRNYKELLTYMRRFKLLFLTNLFYTLGLYIHNFVFWNYEPVALVVGGVLKSAPVYDTATYLAMITSVSATVIFTVRVEINFHDRYKVYCQHILGGIGEDIVTAKQNMFKMLVKEIVFIVQMQMIITVIVFLVIMIFSSFLGFGGLVISIYPALAAGYYIIFIMYCMIVFLYYFDDRISAFISSLIFFAVTFAVSVICTRLNPNLYGLGPVAGAFSGWTVSFFRIKYIERNLESQMYCKGDIVKRVYQSEPKLGNLIEINRETGAKE